MIDGALPLKSTAEGILKLGRTDYAAKCLCVRQLPLKGMKLMLIVASSTVPMLKRYPGWSGAVVEEGLNGASGGSHP